MSCSECSSGGDDSSARALSSVLVGDAALAQDSD